MASDHKTVHAVVHGRVQGVFFRDSCRRRARELGISGWVRNRSDGTVEAMASGRSADVDALVSWLHVGPPHADVTEVRVQDATDPGLTGFQVR
jgi:acylphosphatase